MVIGEDKEVGWDDRNVSRRSWTWCIAWSI